MRKTRTKFMAARLAVLAIVGALLSFVVAPTVRARFLPPPQIISVGTNWNTGYIVMPQRGDRSTSLRQSQESRAALLARQRGLAIVAAGDAADVAVVDKDGGRE